jgi:pilus assembly protein FimV
VFVAATLESVKKAIGKKSSSLAFAWLADLERKAGKPDVALDTVNTGLSYLHDYLPGLLVRSAIYFDLERFDEVIEACEFIVKKDPFCIAAWRRLGAAYHKINQIGKRNFCYRMVHDMDPLDSFWKEEYTFIPPEDIAVEEKAEELESVSNDVSKSVDLQDDSFEIPSEEAANVALATPPDLSNEDPFSLLSNLLPSDEDNAEDASLESLESTLDNVMDKISGADESLPEFFGGDDISENDVSSAFSSMFGMDDELPSEKTVSPFASFEIPTSIDDEEDVPEPEPVATVSEEVVEPAKKVDEDKPQSLSSAFDDIFGQDELPEEFSASDDLTKDTFEKSAFNDLEEKPFENMFEKSAFNDLEEKPFENMFEKSASNDLEEKTLENTFEKSAFNDLEEKPFENMFEKSDVVSDIEKSISEEIEESSFETMFEKNDVSRVTESPISDDLVDNSFENTFEKSDLVSEIDKSLLMEPKKVDPKNEAEEFVSAVDSSLSALFGEDDLDLPKENKSVPVDESIVKNNIENSFSALFGEDDDLELPSIQNAEEPKNDGAILRSIEEDVGHSFSALFGKDDDSIDSFDSVEKIKESSVLSSSDLDSPIRPIEVKDEVSGAFASLFSSDEDDDLPKEKSKERDGVDFLMSGDSDDEMAVALMKNPSASLDQDEILLDENLNTKTLAEIYFEQGLYSKALNIYQDLIKKNPLDLDLQKRLSDIQRQVNEKFGDT